MEPQAPRTAAAGEAVRRRARNAGRQQAASERIAAATEEMATGFSQLAASAQQLSRAAAQIASGAEQSSGAAQESQAAIGGIVAAVRRQKLGAETVLAEAEKSQGRLTGLSRDIGEAIANIGLVGRRQTEAVRSVTDLEKQTTEIGGIVRTVAQIADQTNLLALNAAIEAARAAKHGKGFAVVADEVRTLAQTAERSSSDIESQVGRFRQDVETIVTGINRSAEGLRQQVERGEGISGRMAELRTEMHSIVDGAREISLSAQESERAVFEIGRGAESISAAAEEQASACEEAARMAGEQSQAISGAEQAARRLAEMADQLQEGASLAEDAEEMAVTGEQLSSIVQEVSRSASQTDIAISQIVRGSEMQSSAAQQSASAVAQVERGAQLTLERSRQAAAQGERLSGLLRDNREIVETLIDGVALTLKEIRVSQDLIRALELVSRRIEKTVDAIAMGAVQTNMLAVSGTIEAARSGDFGRGFAVVSSDIRSLAQDSADNADRIKDMVRAMQDSITVVRRDLDEIAGVAAAEAERTQSIRETLAEMEDDVARAVEAFRSILAAASEITGVLAEIRRGVEQIAAAALESSQATQEAATAAREQLRGTEDLSASIEEIASLAAELGAG